MMPYVPTWEAHNTSADNLVGKFTKAYCNLPRGKVKGQKSCVAAQLMSQLKDKIMESLKLNDEPTSKSYRGIKKTPATKPYRSRWLPDIDPKPTVNASYKKVPKQFIGKLQKDK